MQGMYFLINDSLSVLYLELVMLKAVPRVAALACKNNCYFFLTEFAAFRCGIIFLVYRHLLGMAKSGYELRSRNVSIG